MAEKREVKVGQVYKHPDGGLMVVTDVAPDGYVTVAPFEEAVFDTHVTVATAPEADSAPQTTPAPCRHEGAKWDSQNRYLECKRCGGTFSPGVCLRCGRPAGGTAADGTVFSTDGFACSLCRGA